MSSLNVRELGSLLILTAVGACMPARHSDAGRVAPLATAQLATIARLLEAGDARRCDTALFDEATRSPSVEVRGLAARTMGQIGALALESRLRVLAADSMSDVAADAVFALGLLHQPILVPVLDTLLRSAQPSVAAAAAWGLGEIGAPARDALEAALRRTDRATGALPEVLLAAAKLRPVPASLVAPYLASPDPTLRWRAAYALARSRVPAGVRVLLAHADAPDALTRAQIARGIARGAAGDSLAGQALTALARLSRDEAPQVRVAAARSLASYGVAGRLDLLRLAHDSDANVRIAVAQSLAPELSLTPADWGALRAADTLLVYQSALLAAAVAAGTAVAADQWRGSREWQRRAAFAEALARAPDPVARLAALLPLTSDNDGRVRAAALAGLSDIADTGTVAPRARALLVGALTDRDPYVRAAALGALADHPRASEVSTVAAAYRRALREPQGADVRTGALRYLDTLWRRDSASIAPALADSLRELPMPSDLGERQAARAEPLFAAWPLGGGAVRPAAWYDSTARATFGTTRLPIAVIRTARGEIAVELLAHDAPLTVANFVRLAHRGYYDHLQFHRVVPAFVAQDGDPRGDGNGGPGWAIRDELNRQPYSRGTMGMALSGPNTGGSQYFLTLAPQPHLDGHYTVFGRLVSGFATLDALVQGDVIDSIEIR